MRWTLSAERAPLASAVTRRVSIRSMRRTALRSGARLESGEPQSLRGRQTPRALGLPGPGIRRPYINDAAKTPSRACRIWRTAALPRRCEFGHQGDGYARSQTLRLRALTNCSKRLPRPDATNVVRRTSPLQPRAPYARLPCDTSVSHGPRRGSAGPRSRRVSAASGC